MEMTNMVFNWVVSNGYADLNEWAADNGYQQIGRETWCDDEGRIVDLWECANSAMEATWEDN